ncbi:MAG: hypothetical protein K0R84_307 [Clostridia bacterium]|nr:hypothetical protein [Clostridia bacterium]
MEPILIANKYKVLDTLYKSELQNIYVAEDTENFNIENLIVNEIMDGSIIFAVKDMFNEDLSLVVKNFVDYFYQDLNFYIVSKATPGTTLSNHLSTVNLRISDKMYITESLLSQLIKLESANRLIKYHLLDLENLSIIGSRTLNFNLAIKFDKDALYATEQSIIKRLGDVICCIFANTPKATLEDDKDNLPPTIASLVTKCNAESYKSINEVYNDFKASLLYSTFIGNGSVDKQIMKNIQKAKRKRSARSVKRLTAAVIILALIAGAFFARDELMKYLPAFGGGNTPTARQNQIPVAKFILSKNKIYAGDKIDFVCEASDPDIDDEVTSYEWSVSRNDDMYILFSREKNPSYTFEADGDYVVSLIVKDKAGISSNAYKVGFKVLPREEIPDDPGEKLPDDILK